MESKTTAVEGTREIELAEGIFCVVPPASAAAESFAVLRAMQQEGQLCDVVLETESGDQIAAHRNVLAACSPYFRAMFVGSLAESNQKIVYLKEIDFDVLKSVVSYAYNSEFSLPADEVMPLLIASDLLQIKPLFSACCSFLETQVQLENCLSIRAFAGLHNCKQLFELCTEFAAENFERVVGCEEYLSLPCSELKDLISRDEVRVSCEEQVYAGVLKWVYHDLESRREEFPSLMSHVRLPFVSSEFLSGKVEEEYLMQSEEQCQEFIQEAYLYKSSPEKRPSLKHSPRTKPRKISGLQDVILAAGGMSKNQPTSSVEQYDMRTDTWTDLTAMEVPRYSLAACCHDGNLYMIGGYSEKIGSLNSVERYSIKEDKWSMVSPMHHARRYHSAGVLYGLLYACGGQSSDAVLSSVECYNPASDSWTFTQPMSSPRMYHGIAEMAGLLFAVGGHTGYKRLNSVEFYDPGINHWSTVAPMNIARSIAGVASLGGVIYAVGGYDGKGFLDSMEYYDMDLDQWFVGPAMASKRSALGLVAYCGCLYACSGSFLHSVERYAPGASKWEPVASMQVERVHFGITCT